MDAPAGEFRLRAGLAGPGRLPLADAVEIVAADWGRQADAGQVAPLTVDKAVLALRRLRSYAAAQDVVDHGQVNTGSCQRWVDATNSGGRGGHPDGRGRPPGIGTRHYRRGVLRQFFAACRNLGLHDTDPARPIVLPARSHTRYSRGLTEQQAQDCRDGAYVRPGETRLPAVAALALDGVTTAEIPAIRVRDLHLDHALLWAHGGGVRTAARWVALDPWAVEALARHVEALAARHDPDVLPDVLLVYRPRTGTVSPDKRQAAACAALSQLLALAGLAGEPGLRAASFTEYAGARVFARTGRIEAVAAALGMASLDSTADLLGHDWRDAHRTPGPPGVPDPDGPATYAGVALPDPEHGQAPPAGVADTFRRPGEPDLPYTVESRTTGTRTVGIRPPATPSPDAHRDTGTDVDADADADGISGGDPLADGDARTPAVPARRRPARRRLR